jgi:hypothetical protein
MSNEAVTATIVFALFAFLFIGVMLAISFVIDRRRVRQVKEDLPERMHAARDVQQRVRESQRPAHIEVHLADDERPPRAG